MDTQVVDILKITITGLFGAVIAPLVTEVLIPFIKGLKRGGKAEMDQTTTPIEPKKQESTSKKAGKILRWPVIGLVIFLLLGYFLIKPTFLSPCPLFASTSVPITSPAEGSKVPLLTIAQGTACNIPSGKELWLLVVAGGVTGYFPQNGPIVVSSDGKWSASVLLGGKGTNDVGRGFVLYTALADQEGSVAIQNYFKSAPNFKPLDPLSAGIQLINQVQVVRA